MSKSTVSPKKMTDDQEFAERMLRILESQRVLGVDAYPPTLRRLAELCDLRPSDPLVKRLRTRPFFQNFSRIWSVPMSQLVSGRAVFYGERPEQLRPPRYLKLVNSGGSPSPGSRVAAPVPRSLCRSVEEIPA
jgi:hypothetical protein